MSAGRVGDDNRVGDRIDDQIQTVALVAGLRLGDAQRAIVLLDLFARPPKVGDVAQNGNDAGAVPRVLGDAC